MREIKHSSFTLEISIVNVQSIGAVQSKLTKLVGKLHPLRHKGVARETDHFPETRASKCTYNYRRERTFTWERAGSGRTVLALINYNVCECCLERVPPERRKRAK